MVALARILMALLALFLLLAAVFIGGSIGGFLGGGYMIASAVVVIVLWLAFAGLAINAIRIANAAANGRGSLTQALLWANRLFLVVTVLSAITGLAMGFLAFVGCGPLWLSSLYHWGGMLGTILGLLAFFFLPLIVRACVGETDPYATFHRWWWVVFMPLAVASLWGTVWLIPYLVLRGDIDEDKYKWKGTGAAPVYKLPFPGGESSWVIQGNNSGSNHSGKAEYAWDFRRRCGSPVLAARAGTIVEGDDKTRDKYTGQGTDEPNNFITIKHDDDDNVDRYLHIQQGSLVKRSGTVKQGDVIAKVGSVGNSLTGHIHFVVENKKKESVPIKFQDVTDDNGIPRTFSSYTSGNRRVP